MARTSSGKTSSSSSAASSGRGTTGRQRESSSKGAIKEQLLRKKDELLKLKSLDIYLMKDVMGTNPNAKNSGMKLELKEIVKKLKIKNSKTA